MNRLIRCIAVLLFFLNTLISIAQPTKDAGLWNTFNAEYKLNSSFNLVFTEELRLRENFTMMNLLYTDFGIEYAGLKNIKTSIAYRSIQKFQTELPLSFRHRLTWDLSYKKEFNKFSVQYRHRLQTEVKNFYSSHLGKTPEWFDRNKFTFKYEVYKRIQPYAAIEFRTQLYDPRNPFYNMELHRVRYQIGTDIKLGNKKTIGVYYLIQDEFGIVNEQDQYILGLEYSVKF
jgi:hypothetical protein